MAIDWGIIGFGWVASDYMLPGLRAAGHRLAAVCDPDPAARGRAAAEGARLYDDPAELAADPDVEALYVATPNHLHRQGVEAAARAGKPVLCEKPMAASWAEAQAMAAAVRRAGILYRTAFDQRHHPAHCAMREAIATGRIGRVTALRIVYACWVGPDWAESGRENWRIDSRKAGGGALIDLGPHGLDLAAYLLDDKIEEVAALTQNRVQPYAADDGAALIARTGSGVLCTLHVAYNHPETLPRRRLEVVGTEGMLTATDTMGQDPGGSLVLTTAAGGASTAIPFDGASPFERQARAFEGAMKAGPAASTLEGDLHLMALLAQAYRGRGLAWETAA